MNAIAVEHATDEALLVTAGGYEATPKLDALARHLLERWLELVVTRAATRRERLARVAV